MVLWLRNTCRGYDNDYNMLLFFLIRITTYWNHLSEVMSHTSKKEIIFTHIWLFELLFYIIVCSQTWMLVHSWIIEFQGSHNCCTTCKVLSFLIYGNPCLARNTSPYGGDFFKERKAHPSGIHPACHLRTLCTTSIFMWVLPSLKDHHMEPGLIVLLRYAKYP